MVWFSYVASPQEGDLRLLGPPSGQGAGNRTRTRDRRVPADLGADSLATVSLTPMNRHGELFTTSKTIDLISIESPSTYSIPPPSPVLLPLSPPSPPPPPPPSSSSSSSS
ncbi:hypothetical protein PoB_005899900 [Plakobranchus ocellatus]|uniref:Uncharacterized protein n=1 Tax=Plakobranchus ocellatus TaxID=259542 RepID=A0AAV4CIA1_9GAST|nr:hypothetical protein PoB_005899900 [Plakobranchus ocellatus]